MVINASRQSCIVVKEALNRKPIDTTRSTINFLNTLSKEELRTMGIKDRIAVITYSRKFVGKNQHIETIQENIDIMMHYVRNFKGSFISLFQKCFPRRWQDYFPI